MNQRQTLAREGATLNKRGRGSRLVGFVVPAVLWVLAQAIAPGLVNGKPPTLGPNEIQSGYRDVLMILAEGDQARALEALFEFETLVVGDKQPWKRVEDFWRLKLRTLREMLDTESLALLMPVIMLHHDASRMYFERDRPFLAAHSRIMSGELAEIYADRANSSSAREFSGWAMASLGAFLWHPSSVISSADLFYRSQLADPGNPIALMGLGAAYERNATYGKAAEYFSRLLALEPGNSEAALHLALCQLRDDDTLQAQALMALRDLQGEEETDWIRSIAFQEVARVQLADEEVDSAEATLREGLRSLPGDQQLSVQLALVLDGRRRPREALQALGRIDPRDGRPPSPRLIYDVWEPIGMQEVRDRLRKDAASALPILADKLEARSPAG